MPQDANIGSFSSPSATMKAYNAHITQEQVVKHMFKLTIDTCCHFIAIMGGIILIAGVAFSLLNVIISMANEIFATDYSMIMSLRGSKKSRATIARARTQLGNNLPCCRTNEDHLISSQKLKSLYFW